MADSTFPQTLARGESFQWTAEKKKGKKIRNDVNNFLCRVNVYDQAILEKWKFKGPFGNPLRIGIKEDNHRIRTRKLRCCLQAGRAN